MSSRVQYVFEVSYSKDGVPQKPSIFTSSIKYLQSFFQVPNFGHLKYRLSDIDGYRAWRGNIIILEWKDSPDCCEK